MKILKSNVGILTNFEVFDMLKSRGATTDAFGPLSGASPSECKVFSCLSETAACNQTRESVNEFVKRSQKFKLSKTEVLNIINLRPTTPAVIYPIINNYDARLARNEDQGVDEPQELVDLVVEVLPPPPANPEEAEAAGDEQEIVNGVAAESN